MAGTAKEQKIIKLRVITCAYKRPEVFKVFLKSFLSNKKALAGKIDLSLSVTGSSIEDGGECKEIFKKITPEETWNESPNFPISNKWNYALSEALKFQWDYWLLTGSDDIYNEQYFLTMLKYMKVGCDYIGVQDFFLFDSKTSRLKYWPGYENERQGESIGAGRILSRPITKKSIPLWKAGLNKGLDGSITDTVNKLGKVLCCVENDAVVLDIKSDTNIWDFNKYAGENIKPEYLQEMNIAVYNDLIQLKNAEKQKV